jgi:aldehyde:ferredoxin oxidoreductase
LEEEQARKYLGGVGLSAKILWDETDASTEPLSPNNSLIFMVGPLSGTSVPSNSRYTVAGISPLTGIWGEANSGGNWAYELKHAGFDGIVFQGASEKPVYMWVHDGEAELRDASHVWGKGVFETNDVLQKETDEKSSVATIGSAGEKLVKIACIINEGRVGRAAGRCGLGALMGFKRLKAVVSRGTKGIKIYAAGKLRESVNEFYRRLPVSSNEDEAKTAQWMHYEWQKGEGNIKNFSGGDLPGFFEKFSEIMLSGKKYFCRTCRMSSTEDCLLEGRRRQVWQSMIPLGSQCMIDDMESLQEAYDLCQDFGIDCTSAGGVMSFAIEAFEKGLITKADTNGIKLGWGNAQAMLQILKRVVKNEGFGQLLGEGVKKAAEHIGGAAPEYAMHVKGLEIAAHEPRRGSALALECATASRGADHCSASAALSGYVSPELGFSEEYDLLENRFKVEGQAEIVADKQNYMCLFDSLCICKLLMGARAVTLQGIGESAVQPSDLVGWINLVTGWNMDINELMKAGERIFNLKRLFNVRRGISRKDDILPPRILTCKLGGASDAADYLPPIGELLNRYYSYRGWTEEGIPTTDKLKELGLVK